MNRMRAPPPISQLLISITCSNSSGEPQGLFLSHTYDCGNWWKFEGDKSRNTIIYSHVSFLITEYHVGIRLKNLLIPNGT